MEDSKSVRNSLLYSFIYFLFRFSSLHPLNENNIEISTCMDLWFTENETETLNEFNTSGFFQSIANNLANNSPIYKRFHFKTLQLCSQIATTSSKNIRRRSSVFSLEVGNLINN